MKADNDGYSSAAVTLVEPPPLESLPEGKYRRSWEIWLIDELDPNVQLDSVAEHVWACVVHSFDLGASLSVAQQLIFSIRAVGRRQVFLDIVTSVDDRVDTRFMYLTWEILREVDRAVGKIETIQGVERSRVSPFVLSDTH